LFMLSLPIFLGFTGMSTGLAGDPTIWESELCFSEDIDSETKEKGGYEAILKY